MQSRGEDCNPGYLLQFTELQMFHNASLEGYIVKQLRSGSATAEPICTSEIELSKGIQVKAICFRDNLYKETKLSRSSWQCTYPCMTQI